MSLLVSIITPCFNSEKYVSQAIQSVISQTHQNWELLLVDDCSSDTTFSILSNFASQDARIKAFKLDENSGAGVARNFEIGRAHV